MKNRASLLAGLLGLVIFPALAFIGPKLHAADAPATVPHAYGRIVILMVWDGLRPDLVTARDTPNLYEMEHQGHPVRPPSFDVPDTHDGECGGARDRRLAGGERVRRQHDVLRAAIREQSLGTGPRRARANARASR